MLSSLSDVLTFSVMTVEFVTRNSGRGWTSLIPCAVENAIGSPKRTCIQVTKDTGERETYQYKCFQQKEIYNNVALVKGEK